MWLFSVLIPLLGLFQLGAAQQACVIDLAMVVDVSGSIMDTSPDNAPISNWGLVLNFMTSIVNSLDDVGIDGTRIAIATFGNRARVEFDFNDYTTRDEILDHISRVFYAGGNTNTTGGLRAARQSFFGPNGGERSNVADVILLITDGIPTREVAELPAEVQRLKDMNIRILALGVTDSVDEDQLLDIVTNRDTDYFGVENFEDLEFIMERIVTETCRDVTTLPPPVSDCENEADVYLLVDGSGSINENNFRIMKQFASDLVSDLSIDNGQVRMGLALFSDNVDNQFGLTTFSIRSEMQAAIDAMNYPRGRTNTGDAIRYIRETGFNNGDRDNIPNILIIFTDGGSNDQQLTLEQADLARRSGIHIIAVGVGDWTNVYELKSIASFPYANNYIAVDRFTDLNDALKTMLKNLICDNFDECSPNPCVRGTCMNGIDMYHCICPSGWGGINCDRTCRVGNDIVFAIDSSGSVGKDNFLRELDFVRSVVYGLNMQDTRVGALQYSNNPNVEFHLNTYGGNKMGVMNGLSMYYMDGTTNTASAISTMRNSMFTSGNGDRTNNNVGVVITDGRSNDFGQTWQAALDARDRGIDMVAVGIGNNLREKELEAIASYPNGPNVIRASNFQDLPSITEDLLDAICNDVNECLSNPCENQGECGDVMNGYQCFCREGYSGVNCERECDNEYDIIFVIDGSGSIRRERFPLVMEFAVSVVEAFEISPSRARFGAVVFSDNAAVEFQLNSYDRKQDIISALRNIKFIGGRTNIAEALELAKNQMFTSGNGDRTGARNHVILLTDGASNIREGQAVPMAVSMRVDGVKISALGIGEGANTLELRGMASSPLNSMMMMAESFNNLRDNVDMRNQMVDNIIKSTCDEIDRCANNPCQNGDCFDDLHQYICDCDLDWVGQECNISCENPLMDVVLLLDFSGSLDTVFNIVIAFAKEIVHRLPVDRARVGVISFSDNAVINFDLDDHLQKEEILNALSFSRNGGKTNTEEALTVMYSDLFANSRGDRSGVDNKGILVTDGGSNMNREQTLNRARDARDRGIEMFVAAIGDNPDMAEVNGIASDPDSSHVVRLKNAAEVESAADTLASRLCQ